MLVLAVDRLDYEELHLTWLPQLAKVAAKEGKSSMRVLHMETLFNLFMARLSNDSPIAVNFVRADNPFAE